MAATDLLITAGLTGDALDAAITAAINAGKLCANCDGYGGYNGWRCTQCGGTGEGTNA